MKVTVQIDQAVWERSTFEVEIEDGLSLDEFNEQIEEAIDNFTGYGEPGYTQEILDDPVYGIDTQRVAILPSGEEVQL